GEIVLRSLVQRYQPMSSPRGYILNGVFAGLFFGTLAVISARDRGPAGGNPGRDRDYSRRLRAGVHSFCNGGIAALIGEISSREVRCVCPVELARLRGSTTLSVWRTCPGTALPQKSGQQITRPNGYWRAWAGRDKEEPGLDMGQE